MERAVNNEPQRDMRSDLFKKFQAVAHECTKPLMSISDSGSALRPIDIAQLKDRITKAIERVHYMGIDDA